LDGDEQDIGGAFAFGQFDKKLISKSFKKKGGRSNK